MTKRLHPKSGIPVTCRIPEPELTRVMIAARLTGVSRCHYVARAAVERAARDLERLAERDKTQQWGGED